ncbi:MAG: lysine--tRNA ligase, partial [Clostridia bacterium]|nr:lysine--tRNA ligase [Clostridia bacterium]
MENNNANQQVQEVQDINEIIAVRHGKLNDLKAQGKDPYEQVKYEVTAKAKDIFSSYADYEGKIVSIAGRIMSKRVMGKASFIHIQDGSDLIQSYVRIDALGEEAYASFKKLDIGDIVGIVGEVFTTHKGEVSIKAEKYTLLSKSLLPLPEKYHGLKDQDIRYRQRYVDLIVNPEVKDTFIKRSQIITAIREYLNNRGYVEVDTPILNTIPSGANARPFITHHNTLDLDMYLRIAPELYLKRLIVGGFDKVYEMGRLFRNEGMDTKHNPEFTTIELYEAYTDYYGMMEIAEGLFKYVAEKVLGTTTLNYQGKEIELGGEWRKVTMVDLVKEELGLDFNAEDMDTLIAKAKALGVEVEKDTTWGKLLYQVFDELL